VLGDTLQPEFATRWFAVEQYQSIDNTIVQLLASRTSGQISLR
jgi:hypothetical protein